MPSNYALAAAAIRAELKRHNIPASVTSSGYSGGSSVRVRIKKDILPATRREIEAFCDKYVYGHFNGYDDSYVYSGAKDDLPKTYYVFVEVDYSEAIKAEAVAYVANTSGIADFEREGYCWAALNGSWGNFWTARKPRVKLAA
jgi:hypothetical protein